MDAISHAVIGVAVAGLSGQPLAITEPIYIAAVLGSQGPDFDIIAWLRGNFSYLKHHRTYSHSLVGISLWSILIAGIIAVFWPHSNFIASLGWAFLGGLSHITTDYFNTHGAALFWPFCQQRRSYPLLNVFDPVLLSLVLSLFLLQLPMSQLALATIATLCSYMAVRLVLKHQASKRLHQLLGPQKVIKISIMPSLKRLLYWDFLVETSQQYFIGRIGILWPVVKFKVQLPKHDASVITAHAERTPLGQFFRKFTPFSYFEEQHDDCFTQVNIYDLRYFHKQFVHSATIIFDNNDLPCEAYIESQGSRVYIPC